MKKTDLTWSKFWTLSSIVVATYWLLFALNLAENLLDLSVKLIVEINFKKLSILEVVSHLFHALLVEGLLHKFFWAQVSVYIIVWLKHGGLIS